MSEEPRPKPANVIEALARVMEEMTGVGKDYQSPQGYAYRGIESITAAVQKLLGRYGVVFVPVVEERRTELITVNGKPWTDDHLRVVYEVYGPGGAEDRIKVGPIYGVGRDNSDKGCNKALTQAYKYALTQVLCIGDSTGDTEQHHAETDAGPPVDPDEAYRSLGWTSRQHHDTWRQESLARAKVLPEEARVALKEWAAGNGLDWAKPVPHGLGAAFTAELEAVEATHAQDDPGRPFTEGESA